MTIDQLLAELEAKLAARRERKMGDYKLVPMEPTAEMLAAGKYAQEAGCYASGIYADMLAAAPAAQGEPVVCSVCQGKGYMVLPFAIVLSCPLCKGSGLYTTPQPAPSAPTFQLGDHVRKTKGSQWKGRVVGTYSTSLTPEGYAVESDTEKGSVQIYPVGALELVGEDAQPAPDVAGLVEALEGIMRVEARGRVMPVGAEWDAARSALADHRKQGGEA